MARAPLATSIILLATLVTAATARIESAAAQQPRKAARKRPAPGPLDAEREAAALEFVEQHYSPLMEVLIYLKENNPRQYSRAVHELDRTQARLKQIEERSPKRYRFELQSWKLKSEIQLLSARLAMSDSPELREELREAVARQVDLKIALMQADRKQAAERLRRIDASLKRLEDHQEQEVERLTQQLVQKVRRLRKSGAKKRRERSAAEKKIRNTKPARKNQAQGNKSR